MVQEQAPPKAPLRPLGSSETNGSAPSQAIPADDKTRGFSNMSAGGYANITILPLQIQPQDQLLKLESCQET